jgi:hypothetical protein
MDFEKLISNLEEILNLLMKEDIYYIDEAIQEYDNENRGINKGIVKKRKKILFAYMEVIFKNVQNKKFDDVEKNLVKLYNFIRDDYYKSTLSNYQGFRDYNDQLKSIKDNFRYVLYNIERYQNGKSLDEIYPTYPKNYKSNLFKLNAMDKSKSSSSGVSSYVSSVSGYDADLKYVKTNVKVLRKYMKALVTMVKEATVKKNISSLLKTNALDKKFISLYKKICKSLEINKDEKVKAILVKMKKLNITQSIDDFNKHIETEKMKHIREFKASVLSSFFTMKLTKTKLVPFL